MTLAIRMSSEVCQLCLEALTPLAEQCAKAQETDSPLFLATRHFLKVDGARGRSRLSPEEGTLPLVQTRRGPPGVRRALGGHLWTGLRLRSLLLRTEVGGASHGDVTKPPQQAATPHLGLGLEKRFPWLSDRVMRRGAAPQLFGTDRGAGGRGAWPRGLTRGLCFQLVFDMLVLQKHDTEMTTAAGEAFYTLVCLHQVPGRAAPPALLAAPARVLAQRAVGARWGRALQPWGSRRGGGEQVPAGVWEESPLVPRCLSFPERTPHTSQRAQVTG